MHARGYSKMTKRARASSDSGVPKAKHRIGYDPTCSWKTTFPWHVAAEEESDSGSSSTSALSVTGLYTVFIVQTSSHSTTEWRWHLDRQALYLTAQGHAGEA